jgi:biopolymer transport protein TolR
VRASSIRLDLPRAEGAKPNEAPRFVTVVLDKEGRTFLDDKPMAPQQLAERLAQAARDNPDTEIQLRADQAVPYGRVVEIMGAAQKAGLNRIGFVADPAGGVR